MKVLLCALNSQYIHSCPAVWSLRESARLYADRYALPVSEPEIAEYTVNDAYERVLGDLLRRKPDVIAFSVYIWNVNRVRMLCADLKKVRPACRIVLGGPEVSFGTPDFPSSFYDEIIRGEGERRFFAFLCRLEKQPLPADFDPEIPVPADEIPFLYTEENLPAFQNRILYYEASRGCPFSCAYCLSGAEDRLRVLPLARVKEELSILIRSRVPQVKFIDRTFNCDRARCTEILRFLLENAPAAGMNFHFECAGDLFTEEQLALIRSAPAGLFQFEIGIQSTEDRALRAAARKTDTERVLETCRKLVSFGNTNIHVDLIAGLPFENAERFSESFDAVYALGAHQLQLGFLKLLHGAALNTMTEVHGYAFSDNPPYEILYNRYLSADELLEMKAIEDVLNRYYNSGRFSQTLPAVVPAFGRPWHFYRALSSFFLQKGLIGSGISARRAFELLFDFLKEQLPEQETLFAETLLLDFYETDPSEVLPLPLRPYFVPEKQLRRDFPEASATLRAVGETLYRADYGRKDPVTNRYLLIPLKKEYCICNRGC